MKNTILSVIAVFVAISSLPIFAGVEKGNGPAADPSPCLPDLIQGEGRVTTMPSFAPSPFELLYQTSTDPDNFNEPIVRLLGGDLKSSGVVEDESDI